MSSPTLPDTAALVAAACRGDHAAWETLFERHDRLILSVCRAHRLSEADAADVRQTTWLRAIEHLGRLTRPERLDAWLGTTARRECLRLLRHAKRVVPAGDTVDAWYGEPAAPDARLLAGERRAAVRRAVRSLCLRDRALIGLLYSEATPSYGDIGRSLKMPVGSIGPTRGRVLDRLRQQAPIAELAAAA